MEQALHALKWEPVLWQAKELIQCLQQHRNGILIYFFYADAAYEIGARVENGRTIFFLNDAVYPSMLAFCSSAAIEGVLLSDMRDSVAVFAINGTDPAAFTN